MKDNWGRGAGVCTQTSKLCWESILDSISISGSISAQEVVYESVGDSVWNSAMGSVWRDINDN